MLITFTVITKKEHPTPSFLWAVHFLQFLLGTRLHEMSFLCPNRPERPFILLLVILSDEFTTFEVI